MPVARCSRRCGSSNAFRLQAALWNLFLDQQQPLNFIHARRITLSHRSLQDVQSKLETLPTGEGKPKQSPSIPPSDYINTASLRDTLQALREQNRDQFLGKDKASASGIEKKNSEIDVLFENHQFDINEFSFPQHKNFERPTFEESGRPVSNEKSSTKKAPITKHSDGLEAGKPRHKKTKKEKIVEVKKSHTAVETLEYEGMYVRPSMGQGEKDRDYPWAKNIPSNVHGRARLDAEIFGFLEYIKPTPAEAAATATITQDVRSALQKYAPHLDSEVFGSQASGLALATSDIDIRVFYPEEKDQLEAPRPNVRRKMTAHLSKIRDRLHYNNDQFMMVTMRHARYPLISMVHKKSGLDVQIVASNSTSNAQRITKQYLDKYPHLYAVFAFTKTMLDIRGLSDVYRGGLGSYSLFMMIVAAMERKEFPAPCQPTAEQCLRRFFTTYVHLDTYKHAISPHPPYSIDKHKDDSAFPKELESQLAEAPGLKGLHSLAMVDPMQPYLLCLQDPADPLNDLGRKGYGWKHIQATIKTLVAGLNHDIQESDRGNWKGSLIAAAVGPCSDAYKARRAITEAYGQKILDNEDAQKEAEKKAEEQKAVEAEAADI